MSRSFAPQVGHHQEVQPQKQGFTTSVQIPSASFHQSSVSRMGLSSENARMDLNESAERLNAQVEAIKVLSTVRQMQDEIQDINQQIEMENAKFPTSRSEAGSLESEIEQLESEMQLFPSATMLTAEDSNDDLGDALRLLAAKQKLQNTQKLIAEAQLRKAESALQQQQQLEREKEDFISQIEATKRKQVDIRKQQIRSKMRSAFLDRIKKKKAQDAHKNLFAASNQRIITRLEDMKNRRKKIAELKKKKAVQQQLSKVNAVRLLQQKKLSNLRKGQQSRSPSTAALLKATQTSSALTKLSPNEKLQMLSWLDLERNAEILASTDRKIKEKMKAKLTSDKLVRQAARQIVDDYDDYYDDLTDEEIDEILLTIAGGEVEDDYYDDFIDEYVDDDIDLLDLLGDYDVDPIRPVAPAPVAPVAPIVPAVPQATPAPLLPQAQPFVGHPPTAGVFTPTAAPVAPFFPYGGAGPTSPAGPVYHPHTTPTPYHPSVTPSGYHAPVTPSYGAPLAPVKSSYGPPPTPPSYHHDSRHHDYHHHSKPYDYHDDHHKTTVTHLHFPVRPKKPYPATIPTSPPPAKIEIHHHHSTPRPEPLHYKEDHFFHTKPTPKPYFSTRPPRRPHHYDLHDHHGPPYTTNHGYDDDYDYEYYDSYDPPPHFEPHKIKSHYIHPTVPAPYKYSTPSPKPYINTYSTPVTPKPFIDHTTTLKPYHAPRYIPEEEYYRGYDHAPLRHHDHHAPLRHHPSDHLGPPHHGPHHGPDHFSGQQFLSHVGHIFDGAATGQLHPSEVGPIVGSTLLQDIQDKVHSELNIGPEGGKYTKIVVGETTPVPPAEPPPFLPGLGGFQPRVDITPKSKPVKKVVHKRHGHIRHDGYPSGSNDKPQKSNKVPPRPKKGRPQPEGQLSFSELMSDFLQKPLPFKAAQKSRHLDPKDPPYG